MTYPKDEDRDAGMGLVLIVFTAVGLFTCLVLIGLIATLIFGG